MLRILLSALLVFAAFTAAAPTASAAPPCDVGADPLGLTVSATCTVAFCEVGPVVDEGAYDHAVSCQSPLVCVTEPCPGSGRIEV